MKNKTQYIFLNIIYVTLLPPSPPFSTLPHLPTASGVGSATQGPGGWHGASYVLWSLWQPRPAWPVISAGGCRDGARGGWGWQCPARWLSRWWSGGGAVLSHVMPTTTTSWPPAGRATPVLPQGCWFTKVWLVMFGSRIGNLVFTKWIEGIFVLEKSACSLYIFIVLVKCFQSKL